MFTTAAPNLAGISWDLDGQPQDSFLLQPGSDNNPTNDLSMLLFPAVTNQTSLPLLPEKAVLDQSHNASMGSGFRREVCPEHNGAVEVFKTVGILFTVAMGVFGNALSFLILKLQAKKSTMNLMMMILAVVDNFYLITVFTVYILETKSPDSRLLRRNVALVSRIAQFMSIWMIIIIGLIRLLAIRRPLQVKTICTAKRLLLSVVMVLIFDIVLHIPQFDFELSIWKSAMFRKFYFAVTYNLLLMFFIPFTILLVLNFLLLRSFRSNNAAHLLPETKHHGQEHRDITKVVVAIISTFIVSYSVFAIVGIVSVSRTVHDAFFKNGTCLHKWILNIMQMSCYINSSVNFFIYFFLRKSFRDNLRRLLPDRPTSRRASDTSYNAPIVSI